MTAFSSNKIVNYLITSDVFFWMGWGLLGPIFPIFIIGKIEGGDALVVGIASAISLIARSTLRVPLGILLDKCISEKDDYLVLVLGLFITAFIPLGFIVSTLPIHLYALQAVHGVGTAMVLAGWSAMFTRHINKGKESTQWGVDSTAVGFAAGITGIIGGFLVNKFGFDLVFVIAGVAGLVSAVMLFGLRNDIKGVFDNGLARMDFKSIFNWKDKEKNNE